MHFGSDVITGSGAVGAEGPPLLLAGTVLLEYEIEAVNRLIFFFHVNLPGVCFYIVSLLIKRKD